MKNKANRNQDILTFERYSNLGPSCAAKFLGVSYSNYATWKSGNRALPRYIERHIETLYSMSEEQFRREIQLKIFNINGN